MYAGLLDGRLVALDAETGRLVWVAQTTPVGGVYSVTVAPRVVKGKVIIGNSGAEFGVRGYVTAYDAETGEQVWRTYTVPGDPSLGFESTAMEFAAQTWEGNWWEVGGGGTVWDGMAFDPEADLLYIGTGNGSPWTRQYRSNGVGDNLYLSSILALDPDDGEQVWYYQTTPGDDWDYTAVQNIILADLVIDGQERQILMQAPKNGFFYVLDRITGELLSAEAFAYLTWAYEVDMETGRPIETPEARYGTTREVPGFHPALPAATTGSRCPGIPRPASSISLPGTPSANFSNSASLSGVAVRVRARTLENDTSPLDIAREMSGSSSSARAALTFSFAVPRVTPIRQASHSAHDPKASSAQSRCRSDFARAARNARVISAYRTATRSMR